MSKFKKLTRLTFVLIILLVTAGGIKVLAEQNALGNTVSLESVKVGADLSGYDEQTNTLTRSITIKRQAQALANEKKQQALVASQKTSSKTTVSTAKSSKTSTVKASSTKTATSKTTVAKSKTTTVAATAVRSKTVASRGTTTTRSSSKSSEVVSIAMKYLGAEYVHGGSSPSTGFDCSGFTMYVYSKLSISLPHSSSQQYNYGTRIRSISDLKPGDLVFFYSPISHVGIYIGDGKFIHAANSRKGVITTSLSDSTYKREFVGAVRLLN